MIAKIFNLVFFLPLYNLLLWLSAHLPGADVGLAIIVLTLLVRILLFPLQHRIVKTQAVLKKLEPSLQRLKEKYAADKAEQARQVMALYREHGVNPFAGFLTLLIQLPILLALFWVFKDSFRLNPDWVYSFITHPDALNPYLLGWLDISSRNYFLALAVGISQFIQMKLASPPLPAPAKGANSFGSDLGRSLNWQMRYIMPAMVAFFAGTLPAAISLYWLTSNLFSIVHEWWLRRLVKDLPPS